MDWKPIPDGEEYFICRQGLVIRDKYFDNGTPNLNKTIKPSVQGKHCYVRIRRQGKEKKIQLYRILLELFPDLFETEVIVDTLKGPWSLTSEMQGDLVTEAITQQHLRQKRSCPRAVKSTLDVKDALPLGKASEAESSDAENNNHTTSSKRCATCDVKKHIKEFSLKRDICNDCFLDREELLKELVNKRLKLRTQADTCYTPISKKTKIP